MEPANSTRRQATNLGYRVWTADGCDIADDECQAHDSRRRKFITEMRTSVEHQLQMAPSYELVVMLWRLASVVQSDVLGSRWRRVDDWRVIC